MTKTLTEEQAAVQARIDQLAPLREIVNSQSYQGIVEGLSGMRATFLDDPLLFAHIDGLAQIMPRLKQVLANQPSEVPADAEAQEI